MDEQMRRERARREKRRKKKRIRKLILRIEAVSLVLLLACIIFLLAKEYLGDNTKEDAYHAVVNEVEQNEQAVASEVAEQSGGGEKDATVNGEADGEPDGDSKIPDAALENEQTEDFESEQPVTDENTYVLEDDQSEEILLTFAGDICFHDEYSNMHSYVQKGSDIANCISADLMEQMRSADVFMVNNEFTYTTRGEPTPNKTYAFRSKPENVKILSDMGVDIVSLANNHSYDYGEISLLDTLETLEDAGIPYVGAGRNLEEASKSVSFIKNGIKVTYLSATQIERLDNPDTKGATENSAGTFRCWDKKLQDLLNAIEKAKSEGGFVVVYMHWGTENTDVLDWAQLDQAQKIAQAGADLIIGDHPHCLQQFAKVEGVPVIYSLGNYWFNSKTVDTGLVNVVFTKDGIKSYQFVPAIQQNCTTIKAEGAEKERILSYMRQISTGISIDSEGFVTF